jgi:pimeloyl-ACP methyl ester carboxylesterase
MVDAKTRLVALAALAGVGLSGCELSQKDPNYPDSIAPTTFTALFLDTSNVPWPNDLLFAGSTDGTLNIPAGLNAPPITYQGAALNALDGWSPNGFTSTSFNFPLDASTLTASNIRVVELYLSNTNKAPAPAAELPPGVTSPVIRVLTPGTDYAAQVSPDIDSGGRILSITPLKPLRPSTGATNIGYLFIVTNGIRDTSGNSAAPSSLYAAIKSAPADCSAFTDPTQKGYCQFTKWQLAIAQAVGIAPANVVVTWSYTTQSVEDTFIALSKNVPAQAIGVQATGLTTKQADPRLQGKANIYVGTTVVPYYLTKPTTRTDRVVLTNFWQAAGPSPVPGIDPASRNLTRFNPFPGKTADATIPLLVTVPNATAAGGTCVKPTAGWPVAVFQHGIGQDRTNALAIADGYAEKCFVVAAIDLPLHGITNAASPLYQAANERTFNVDLVNNTAGTPPGDGIVDASGTHFINVLSGLTQRDNLRQSEADLIVFEKSVAKLDLTGDGVSDIDPARIHFVGHSLGGIVGGAHVAFAGNTATAVLSVPGGIQTQLLLDSATFGPRVVGVIGAPTTVNGLPFGWNLPAGTTLFNRLVRDLQTAADAGDPINHIFDAQAVVPLLMQRVNGDAVVPNSATNRLIAEGKLKKITAVGPTPVGKGTGGYIVMTAGSHGSLIDPTASLAATVEMQTQAVGFALTATLPGGPFAVITNPAVVEQ